MASDKLARIRWQMGQALLPEHLKVQEESLLEEARIRFQFGGIPCYGFGRLEWNESLLKEGVLSIIAMSLVLPSGELIDIPGNGRAQPFNLNVAGSTKVAVYLHLIGENLQAPKNVYSVDMSAKDEEIERIVHAIEISSEQSHPSAVYSIKLAEFNKDGEGAWILSEDYVPPLLQVGTSPFFSSMLNNLAQLVELFHFKLEREIMSTYLSGENLFTAKQCLQGLYKLQHFFGNLKNQVHYHPYFLYEALKFFYIDLCIYQSCTPENVETPYLHDQIAKSFLEVSGPLMRQIQEMKAQNPYVPFKKQDHMFVVSKLPKEVKNARELYLLIQKPKVTSQLSTLGLKLASLSRLPMMHQMALQGIPFKKIDRPPFQHTFGVEVDFFLLAEGEEWDHALGESTIAFYEQAEYAEIQAYIYWRQG